MVLGGFRSFHVLVTSIPYKLRKNAIFRFKGSSNFRLLVAVVVAKGQTEVKWERSIQPKFRTVRLRKVVHLKRWTKGAYHLTENFGNSGWKVNGKVTFRKFQPKIEEYVLR